MSPALQNRAADLLISWLLRQLSSDGANWFSAQMERLSAGAATDRDLYLALGMVPRRLGKQDLMLQPDDLAAADRVRPGWDPTDWSVDQAARITMLLLTADSGDSDFVHRLEGLFATADLRELIAFYRGLPLYPEPAGLKQRAGEGARTNMKAVFEAVAHRNPYPSEQFADPAWNQLVLKAVFIGSTINPIYGFDQRRNPALASTLVDYAHERRAAGRDVTPELWRGVGPFADSTAIEDLRQAYASTSLLEREAAGLALSESRHADARSILGNHPDILADIEAGRISWDAIHRRLDEA